MLKMLFQRNFGAADNATVRIVILLTGSGQLFFSLLG